jgi:Amino acid transporters
MIFCLVAAGCYGIEEMVPAAGPGMTVIMLIVLPFVWGMPFGLVASELGSVRPQEGGYYKWVQEAFGEFWGFQAGWWRTVSIYIDNTLYVILAGGYAATEWHLSSIQEFILKAAMIIIFTYINVRGVKDVGIVSTVLSVIVIASFAAAAIVGFMHWSGGIGPLTPEPARNFADWLYYIGAGISVGMWMYSGYESMSTIAGEIEDPQVISKGTILSVPLIMLVYILPTIAGLGSVGKWQLWGTEVGNIGYSDIFTTYIGPASGVVFIVVSILAQCSIYNTYIASGSRGFFSLAGDHLAPPVLVKCDKKRGVPYVAVLSVGIVNLILCMLPFDVVVVVDVFMLISSYILVYLAELRLRKTIPREEYKFRIPGGKWFIYTLCIVPMTVAVISFFINGSDYFIGGMVGVATGPLLYAIWKRKYGGITPKDPRTGLGFGDLKHISNIMFILSGLGAVGILFLPRYEAGLTSADYFGGIFAGYGNVQTVIFVLIGAGTVITAVIGAVIRKLDGRAHTDG